MTLAELYSHPAGGPTTARGCAPARFGFARALTDELSPTGSSRHRDQRGNASHIPRTLTREYDALRLRIDPVERGSYRVLASTRSAEARGSFEVPFCHIEIRDFISRISDPAGRNRFDSGPVSDAKHFGGEVFKSLFHGQVYGLYRDALAEARSRGRGLRITLCLSGSPELIELPWEYLFDAPDFLAISAFTPIVRYLDLPRSHRPLAVEPPLRILGVVSSPADYQPLEVQRERAKLEGALSELTESGAVELRWLEQPTLDRLLRTLQLSPFHALHYIGHGRYDGPSDTGMLLFEDDSGWGSPVTGEKLGTVLHEFSSLRLAVLNACTDDVEWGTPVLYMRVEDGRIFDLADGRADAARHRRAAWSLPV